MDRCPQALVTVARFRQTPDFGSKAHAVMAGCCKCKSYTVTQPLTADQIQNALTVAMSPVVGANTSHALRTMAGVPPRMSSLQHLGLHHLPLKAHFVPFIGELLLDLPASLTTLTASVTHTGQLTFLQRSVVFSAIAQTTSLKELYMADWETIVGSDAACVEPLYLLPLLEVVYVKEVMDSISVPAGLDFKKIP